MRNRIITEVMKAFQNREFLLVSMSAIADNAGVALGNVSRYFKSKEDLFNEIVEPAGVSMFLGIEKLHKQEMHSFKEIVYYLMKIMKEYKIQLLPQPFSRVYL